MAHLNNPEVYKPLTEDIPTTLKQNIIEKLKLLHRNGFLKQDWFEFCKPPDKHRTSRLYFLKKIHKNPMGIRPIVSSCNSITEPISNFVDKCMASTKSTTVTLLHQRFNTVHKPNRNLSFTGPNTAYWHP